MPQDNLRTETKRAETRHTEQQQRGGNSTRSEQMRGENMAAAETFTAQIGDMGKRSYRRWTAHADRNVRCAADHQPATG